MKLNFTFLASLCILMAAMISCGDEPAPIDVNIYPAIVPADSSFYKENPLWQRHKDSPLKILAIGNSYTDNSTLYVPWLLERLNGDSICIAKLMQSGCSLQMHWGCHVRNAPEYSFYYSDDGLWISSDISTLDEALALLDWDIITIQQYSAWAGLFSTYQPYLDALVWLFRATNPDAQLAWHYTWPYTSACKGYDFTHSFDRDPEKMYQAIISTGDRISGDFDIRILSATLIKRLREAFPEVEDGFTSDGSHITDPFARYALSSLWYDVLVAPSTGTSRSSLTALPGGVDASHLDKMEEIIKEIDEVADVLQIVDR